MKVKFDWNKNTGAPSSSSSSAVHPVLNLNHLPGEKGSSSSSSFLEKSASFGSGVISAFTSTAISLSSPSTGGPPSGTNYCCLTEDGSRCTKISGNASYSKRIQKIVQQKKLRLSIDNSARHVYICDHHKTMIQSVRGSERGGQASSSGKRKRAKDDNHDIFDETGDMMSNMMPGGHHHHHSDMGFHSSFFDSDYHAHHQDGGRKDPHAVDLASLQVNTLRRYKKHFHVPAKPGLNKQQLAETLHRHFRSIPVNEKEAITYFIFSIKLNKNKLDRGNEGNVSVGDRQEASSSSKSSGNHLNHSIA